ncbi:hypothetical protein AVEN_114124-1 [Araneus ventricosus]|uniref:Uncharacterized protein n=1 Tax=Araneus ventricosus TaxID=182803 RepID=A0A4Y2Q481_ARAVE|nr:hypothetical protein AVEN_114124-1 [Araneus ventricosus]
MPKRKGNYRMLPSRRRQLENVKGEWLKLKKKEAAIVNYGKTCQDRRAKKQKNKEIADVDMAQRVQERRAEQTEEQRNRRLAVMDT